ncbi:hypothetical protein GKIL_1716 [Gloeobacter kilaueensis JS1]|uniref:Uncharacterized protein n=1 Tax=Gloeobacter kilaueensis (strain ATCC BAA-2537 / CCAP 1431/1 / ULC 316 / JS1) TaxID=1183438 RepID=U5QG73_GLOK1|nr:hypothetical protein GKIL_1716 [Gloeobacter kilaueensis JS1]
MPILLSCIRNTYFLTVSRWIKLIWLFEVLYFIVLILWKKNLELGQFKFEVQRSLTALRIPLAVSDNPVTSSVGRSAGPLPAATAPA